MGDTHKYDEIINLPHHISKTRKPMSLRDRAAQFAPFAALSGHEAAIKETQRTTDEMIELSEDEKEALSIRTMQLKEKINENPEVTVEYFVPDERKSGGAYVRHTGHLKDIDEIKKAFVFTDGMVIYMDVISEIVSEEIQDDIL